MKDLLLGISLTINIIGFLSVFLYFKIKILGMKKVQKEFVEKYFIKDEEFDDMLEKL